ncbi:hypothetical protein [Flaviaesturariibacter aridisoli]|uniref:Uncharacterized protein n=1 Tax=Flaviaesturariibacter aridisoli TaxID=2545761 RepID=A0A4R4E1R3_9BACT|nr:hypothetical protein [Flaviaesturariibacter aridisoli]TCZ72777.1 hypothetical protein E0486_08325 [Flaviaesturariibacter aridisoli]
MLTVFLLICLVAGAFLAWRFRAFLPLPASGPLPLRAGRHRAAPVEPTVTARTEDGAVPSFLPPGLEADELEADDIQWLLERRRASLQKEETAHLQRESAARFEELALQLDALALRLAALQERMAAWKGALLEREALQLAYEQLRSEHLDQQYGLDALRSENERLQAELAEARKESLLDYEENERLKKQLALLRSLTREGF